MWYRSNAWALSLGVLFLSFSGSSLAQAQSTQWLAPVVVEASAPPAWQTWPDLATGQVTVIRRQDFQPHHLSVADVLGTAPGVQVQSLGETGSYRTVSIRGASGIQALVYVDGILRSSSGGEAVDLSQFDLTQVESIEIYRTQAPPQLSEAAIGGVINIVTRPEAAEFNSRLAFKVGSFGLHEASGAHRWQSGNFRGRLYLSGLTSENDFPFLYDNGTPDNDSDNVVLRRNNADYQREQGGVEGQWTLGDQVWQWQWQGQRSHKSLPAWNNNDAIETWYRRRENQLRLGWAGSGYWQGRLDQSLRLSLTRNSGHLYDPNAVIGVSANDSRDRFTDGRLHQLAVWYRQNSSMTLVNELSLSRFELSDDISGRDYQEERLSHSLALTEEHFLLDDRFTLLLNGRLANALDEPTLWGAQLGGRYQWDAAWWLKVNLTRAFRRPSLFEQYGNEGYFRGNSSLAAEQSLTIDAALGYTTDAIDLELGLFSRTAENAIAPVYDSQGVGQHVNIGDVLYQGLEWHLAWQGSQWSAQQSGAWQRSQVRSPIALYDGRQAPGFYPLSLTSELAWAQQNWQQRLVWRYQQGLYYDRANSTTAPVRNQFDAHSQYRWRQPAGIQSITLSVLNLLNDFSMDATRKPLPGRQFVAAYSVQF